MVMKKTRFAPLLLLPVLAARAQRGSTCPPWWNSKALPSYPGKIGYREERSLLGGVLRRWPSGDLRVARRLVHGQATRVRGGASQGRVLRLGGLLRRQPYLSGDLRVARRLVRGRATRVRGIGIPGCTC